MEEYTHYENAYHIFEWMLDHIILLWKVEHLYFYPAFDIYTYMHINIWIDVTPNIHLLHCIRLRVWGCNKNVGARILRLTLIATYFCSTAKLWIFRHLFEYYIYVDVWRNYENNVILNGWCTIWHVLCINFGINLMFRLE